MATAKKVAAPRKDRLDAKALAQQYGYVNALINSNAELKKLFSQAYGTATSGQWTPTKFQAALQNTTWFKTHSDQWRKTEALRLADPKTFTDSVTAAAADAKRLAASMGATITDQQASDLGKVFYQSNYNQSQQQQALAAYVGVASDQTPGGAYGQALKSIQDYGSAMGIQKDTSWYESAAKSVAVGLSTPEDWQGDIKNEAKSLYVPFAARIDQGATVKDMASSYINQMAQTLELDPNSINMQDPSIQKALKGTVDQKTGLPVTQPLWDFDQATKQDPRWQQTKNANQLATDTAMNVLQSFGFQG